MNIPHDLTDLYLAPVVLAIEACMERLGRLAPDELALEIALSSNAPDWTRSWREQALTSAIEHLIDVHGWSLTVESRSLRLAHRRRVVLMALPPTLEAYLAGPQGVTRLAS